MRSVERTRIELCGPLVVEVAGRRLDAALPGRQGRLLFAYLVLHRQRPVTRDELIALLWPERPPADPAATLTAVLAKLRRALGAGMVDGRRALALRLPADATVDLKTALEAADGAERALASGDWRDAWTEAR